MFRLIASLALLLMFHSVAASQEDVRFDMYLTFSQVSNGAVLALPLPATGCSGGLSSQGLPTVGLGQGVLIIGPFSVLRAFPTRIVLLNTCSGITYRTRYIINCDVNCPPQLPPPPRPPHLYRIKTKTVVLGVKG